jgi:RpiR family transcriptional regulator, carbohydrate utilization regulator
MRGDITTTAGGTKLGNARAQPMDLIASIIDRQEGLSKSNRRIADAILSEPHRFVETPVEALTSWIGVSAPTIGRFARTLGCDGLKDLKLRIMGSMRVGMRYLEPQTPPAGIAEIADRVTKRAHSAIDQMYRGFDLAAAERAVDMIAGCSTLYAFGSGGVSSWLIDEIQNRFFRLGIRVIPCADHQLQFMLASTTERGDLVFCCSLTGDNDELAKAVSVAREYGAQTLGLVPPDSLLAGMVDLLLPVDMPADEDILSPATMRYSYLIAIDVLAYATAIRRKDAGREKLRRVRQQLANARDTQKNQPLCD